MRRLIAAAAIVLLAAGGVATPAAAQDSRGALEESLEFRAEQMAYSIGLQAFIYGYPPVDYAQLMLAQTTQGADPAGVYVPVNTFLNLRKLSGPGEGFAGRAPNNDTIYFLAWLDLRASPLVVTT